MSDESSSGWSNTTDSHTSYRGSDFSSEHRNCTSVGEPSHLSGYSETAISTEGVAGHGYDPMGGSSSNVTVPHDGTVSHFPADSLQSANQHNVSATDNALDTLIDVAGTLLTAARQAFADFMGRLNGSVGNDSPNQTPDALKTSLQNAYAEYSEYCNQSTSKVAQDYGINDLDHMRANDQVSYINKNWKEVDSHTAQDLANKGSLVVAGLQNSEGSGHTAIVSPGAGAEKHGEFYPNVSGGGSEKGRSDGTRTVGDVWGAHNRDEVRYYTPPYEARIKDMN